MLQHIPTAPEHPPSSKTSPRDPPAETPAAQNIPQRPPSRGDTRQPRGGGLRITSVWGRSAGPARGETRQPREPNRDTQPGLRNQAAPGAQS